MLRTAWGQAAGLDSFALMIAMILTQFFEQLGATPASGVPMVLGESQKENSWSICLGVGEIPHV
jgi:hypothetical protein